MLFPYLGYAATMNPRVQMSLLHTDFISFGYVTKDSDCVPVVILNFFEEPVYYFFIMAVLIHIPTTVCKSSFFFTYLATVNYFISFG